MQVQTRVHDPQGPHKTRLDPIPARRRGAARTRATSYSRALQKQAVRLARRPELGCHWRCASTEVPARAPVPKLRLDESGQLFVVDRPRRVLPPKPEAAA